MGHERVTELGEVLDACAFDPRGPGVTTRMLRDYQEALDAYDRARQVPATDEARIRAEVDRGYESLSRLELQWLGKVVNPPPRMWWLRRPRNAEELPIEDRPWDGEPLAPLHVFAGKGNKRLPMPDGVGPDTVLELRHVLRDPLRSRFDVARARRTTVHGKMSRWKSGVETLSVLDDRPVRAPLQGGVRNEMPRFLQVFSSTEWTLSLLDIAGVPRFDGSYSGGENDVVLYTGSAGLLTASSSGRTFTLHSLTSRLHLGDFLCTSTDGTVAVSGPTLLQVSRSPERWYLDVRQGTADELPLRSFDRAIEGKGTEVIRYTGPQAQVRIRYLGRNAFTVSKLDDRLRWTDRIIDVRDSDEYVVLFHPGTIVQIVSSKGDWNLTKLDD